MTIDLIKHVLMFLNASHPMTGLSKIYSPHTIMTGKALDRRKALIYTLGPTQVHEDMNATNTLEERTQGSICLGPTGNLQGTYNFFSLRYGNKLPAENSQRYPPPRLS